MEEEWKQDSLHQVMQAPSRADKALKPPVKDLLWQATVSLEETTPRMHEPCRQIPAWIYHWTIWELSYSEVNLSTSPPIITTEQNFKRFYQLLSCSYIPNSSFFAAKRNISCNEGQCKLEQFTVVIKKRLSTIHDKKNFRSNRFALYLK